MSLAPFIGGTIASVLFAIMSDPIVVWASKRNGGVYEPEFRLLPCIMGLFSGAGLLGFGFLTRNLANIYLCAFMSTSLQFVFAQSSLGTQTHPTRGKNFVGAGLQSKQKCAIHRYWSTPSTFLSDEMTEFDT